MSKRRIVEWIKTTAIALLLALAVFLGTQTGLFDNFFKSIPLFSTLAGAIKDSQTTAQPPEHGAILSEAARPAVIVITSERGRHHGVRYDTGAKARAYERTSPVFIEALSTALPPGEITADEWRAALGSPGVYYEYLSPARLGVLAGWLGVRQTADGLDAFSVRRVCVTFGEDANTLYFESGGAFYACEAAAPGGKPSGLEGYSDNGAVFAFETGLDFSFAPYTLIFPQTEHPVLSSEVTAASREMIDSVLTSIGVTGQLESSYIKRGDTLLFIGQAFTVTAAPGGFITLRTTSGVPGAYGGEGQMIERARAIVAGTIGAASGAAEVYFDAVETTGDTHTVTFRYHAAGGLVHLYEDGCAAKIAFQNGLITGIELIFRTFSETGETETLLPEPQILAAAGSEFSLYYLDTGSGLLRPVWARLNEGRDGV